MGPFFVCELKVFRWKAKQLTATNTLVKSWLLPPVYVVRREGNVLTRVCPSIPLSVHSGGVPRPGLDGWGGVPRPGPDGGTPARSRLGGGTPARSRQEGGTLARSGQGGTLARSTGGTPARSGLGYPRWGTSWQGWGTPGQVRIGGYPRWGTPWQRWGTP